LTAAVQENKIARNTTYLTVAYILQKILSFSYFLYYARYIGYVGTGKFTFAVSFVTIFGILVDLGLSPVLIREVARVNEKAEEYLSSILGLKLFLSIISLLAIYIVINFLGKPAESMHLVYLAALVMVLDSFTLSFYGVFRAYQNLKYEAIGSIFNQILVLLVGIVGLHFTHNILILGAAVIFGSLGNFLYALINIIRKAEIIPKIKINFNVLRFLLKIAMPFFLAGIFVKLYAYIDIVLLNIMKGDSYAGWYAVAYKLTYSIQFVPIAFNNAIYPAFSRYFVASKELLARTFENAFFYLITISLPISLGIFVLADKLTVILSKQYEQSIPALQVSILGLTFIFLNFIIGSLLNACNRQKIYMINMGLVVVFNVLANILLIPKLNHVGASLAALLSAIFLFIIGIYWANKIVKYDKIRVLERFLKSFFSAFVMAALIFIFKKEVSFYILIPLGTIFYFSVLFLIRGFTKEEIVNFYYSYVNRNNHKE